MQPINLTVKQLNMYVRSLLEGDTNLASITLEGEISGFKNHFSSGHWYFTLKDNDASVKSVMFKGNTLSVGFKPEDGMRVVCRGYVSLYERDGQFQFYAETMRAFGEGDIAAEFERIKQKLQAEGLFDTSRKRDIPKFPKKIGVITAESGAAFKDILQVTSRRYSACDIVLFPSLVQGVSAPEELIKALKKAYLRSDLDLIIIGRGGGSAEDLAAFNDEKLARTVALSPVPIISAVGHEIDFTICDFVADLRAPTPSAAAELAVPSTEELIKQIDFLFGKITASSKKYIIESQLWLDSLLSKSFFLNPQTLFKPFEIKQSSIFEQIKNSFVLLLKNNEIELKESVAALEALSPKSVMERGYSIVLKNNKPIVDTSKLKIGDELNIRFTNGSAEVKVSKLLSE
ncbi:MAG: exodeoxyribonuclease VII large subunit [Clostridia bacterium]|nr:exodeoxyribonuclease VII large subunit [Clostridia bacterium]